MVYTTIFKTKPKKENKKRFCQRIVELLDEIEVVTNESCVVKGWKMLNYLFKYEKINTGYSDIDDWLLEANGNYSDIYALCRRTDFNISDIELLANIEIVVNCFYHFEENIYSNGYGYFNNKERTLRNIELLFSAIRAFLLINGYKLV